MGQHRVTEQVFLDDRMVDEVQLCNQVFGSLDRVGQLRVTHVQ
uniref:Uncharacterized protein n=1 Tax=Picea glauca TaxID=3330 RepID=A0A101LV52_PICGL|nr:hypothetical protein ABT39_MTgene2254 [Picea glauca]QHR86616.1 hypothetical protein Q903MT_gene619 [Picea sitchensis]